MKHSKTQHCPDPSLLVEFSSGSLETAASICVSAHLHFCAHCRETLCQLDQVGSRLMEEEAEQLPRSSNDVMFNHIMHRIRQMDEKPKSVPSRSDRGFPPSINKLISGDVKSLRWRRIAKSVRVAKLKTGQEKFEVALHKISAGGRTPKHDHQGLEYTVVLKGSFSDDISVYHQGDFILRKPGDIHQPISAQNGECICLSAQSAPIKLLSPLGFIMNKLLRVNPA